MKLVDLNVLLYVANTDAVHHSSAKRWLDGALAGLAPVGFPWLVLVGFVRIITNPRSAPTPYTVTEAMSSVDAWLGARSAQVLHPGPQHPRLFREMLEAGGRGGDLVNDAHLAALALEHKASVVTFDSDFRRFPGVRVERPV